MLNPLEVYWDGLGRHMLPQDEQVNDIEANVARALKKSYEHRLSDRERVLSKLDHLRDEKTGEVPVKELRG